MSNKQVLDPCCGSKMFYFDKSTTKVLFCDRRDESHVLCDGRKLNVNPDKIVDFRDMPFDNEQFSLVVFDPPHLKTAGDKSWMFLKYGLLDAANWKSDLKAGFSECWRVLKPEGTLIFKWNETQIKISELRDLFPSDPLLGHTTTQNLKTHWFVFHKSRDQE